MSFRMPTSPEEAEPSAAQPRRRALTPEQRRFLNTASSSTPSREETTGAKRPERSTEKVYLPNAAPASASEPEQRLAENREQRNRGSKEEAKGGRRVEMHQALLVISVLVFLFIAFFAGRKLDALKYWIATRTQTQELDSGPDKFPGISSEELIETGLAAEQRGDWREATDRLIGAKRKDRTQPGIFFHLGQGCFERGDLASADSAFSQAIRFGENVAASHHYRGLIALQRRELPAAIGYFEAASKGEPFQAEFHFWWGDALRLDFHPRESIKRYERALQRANSAADANLCRFKIRLARIEAGEIEKVTAELEQARLSGSLSYDWLMIDAALQVRAGKPAVAADLLTQARANAPATLFAGCASDIFFRRAADANAEIANVLPREATARPSL